MDYKPESLPPPFFAGEQMTISARNGDSMVLTRILATKVFEQKQGKRFNHSKNSKSQQGGIKNYFEGIHRR